MTLPRCFVGTDRAIVTFSSAWIRHIVQAYSALVLVHRLTDAESSAWHGLPYRTWWTVAEQRAAAAAAAIVVDSVVTAYLCNTDEPSLATWDRRPCAPVDAGDAAHIEVSTGSHTTSVFRQPHYPSTAGVQPEKTSWQPSVAYVWALHTYIHIRLLHRMTERICTRLKYK